MSRPPTARSTLTPRAESRPGRAPTRSAQPPQPQAYRQASTSSPSQTRSESQPGSKVPLLTRGRQLDSRAAPPPPPPPPQDAATHDPEKAAHPWVGPPEPKETSASSSRSSHGGRSRFVARLARHFVGIRGERALPTPLVRPLRHLTPDLETYLLTFLGSFPSILIACAISYGLSRLASSSTSAFAQTPLTVGSFGATAVLLYATPEAPLSQPRNVILGQTLSAVVGAVMSQLFALDDRFTAGLGTGNDNTIASETSWYSLVPLSGALAVAVATLAMQLTGTVHPPGGATALIAAYHRTTGPRYTYILDVFLSVTAMTVWALLVNNLGRRRYPTHWWVPKKPAPAPQPPTARPDSGTCSSSDGTTTTAASAATRSSPPRHDIKLAPPLQHTHNHPPLPRSQSVSLSRSRSGVSPRLDPAADLDLDPVALAEDDARSLRNRSRRRTRTRGQSPSHRTEQEGGGSRVEEEEEEEVFTPLEDAERRWLGRLGEEDEEALGPRDEQARREAVEWERRRARERQDTQRERELEHKSAERTTSHS
ncbi:hypothetical protein JCM3774_001973 [Rhodotorula dairenensis]